MARPLHDNIIVYYIYAVFCCSEENNFRIYIGKTKTDNLRKVLSYHRKRGTTATPLFQSAVSPNIYPLETITGNASTAYKHYIAWIRHFLENEYEPLCPLGVYEDAYDLFPDTEEIYHQISRYSIADLLSTPYTPPKVDTASSKPPIPSLVSSRLSIRIKADEYDAFVQFCNRNTFTQREGFAALLSFATEKDLTGTIIQEHKDTIAALKSQIAKLNQLPRGTKADQRLKDLLSFYQTGIMQYIDQFIPTQKNLTPASCYRWNKLSEILPDRKEYHYPQDSQFFLFRFELMCYGHSQRNNAPIFLFGRDLLRDTPVILRYYAKAHFLGVQPPHSPYFNCGTIFLAGCRVAEGVADLYAALPISLQVDSALNEPKINDLRSFDDILSDAINRTRA